MFEVERQTQTHPRCSYRSCTIICSVSHPPKRPTDHRSVTVYDRSPESFSGFNQEALTQRFTGTAAPADEELVLEPSVITTYVNTSGPGFTPS